MRNGSEEEKKEAKAELKTLIDPTMVDSIEKALEEITMYNTKFHIKYERSANESALLEILQEEGIKVEDFSREVLLILSDSEILELLIKPGLVILHEAIAMEDEAVVCIFNPDIVELLANEKITFAEVVEIYEQSDNEEEFLIRIRCETEDPVDIALDIAPEVDKIVMEYLDGDDIEWIKDQLCKSDRVGFDLNLENDVNVSGNNTPLYELSD